MAATWPENVNQRILRDTEWETPVNVIADQTRCGRKKVRPGLTMQPQVFTVRMNFDPAEQVIFKEWYSTTLRNGAVSFLFPDIEKLTVNNKEYRFSEGSSIRWGNPSGTTRTASMQWEEV